MKVKRKPKRCALFVERELRDVAYQVGYKQMSGGAVETLEQEVTTWLKRRMRQTRDLTKRSRMSSVEAVHVVGNPPRGGGQ